MNENNITSEAHNPADSTVNKLDPLHEFYSKLLLTSSDLDELWLKRGLTQEESKRAGFKTNDRANREILESLTAKFSQEVLVESGLWVRGHGGEAKPNSQFCGYGLEARNGGPDDSEIWGWKHEGRCNPILIPYRNANGQLFHLRPHKGGSAGKPPHLYVAREDGVCDAPCAVAVITEGEIKSRALHAVLNSTGPQQYGVAALPGISMAKHQGCLDELRTWLKTIHPARVVVVYDSEDKANPHLSGFRTNPRKRHDAQVWARYLANLLNSENHDAAVGVIPKAWRDPKTGKADWDGRLSARIEELSRA